MICNQSIRQAKYVIEYSKRALKNFATTFRSILNMCIYIKAHSLKVNHLFLHVGNMVAII